MLYIFVFYGIFIAVNAQDYSQCPNVNNVAPLDTAIYGSLNSFYDIAKGIADGLQKTMSDETLTDIYNLIDDQTGSKSVGSVISEVVNSQGGAIAFWCVGLVLIGVSVLLGFIVVGLRCCCSSCYVKREQDADASKIPLVLIIFVLVASIAFFLTGIIIFNQSSLNLYSSVDQSTTWVDEVVKQLNGSLTNGTNTIQCAVNTSVSSSFGSVENQMQLFPSSVFNVFFNASGITDLRNFNFTDFESNLLQASNWSTVIRSEIEALQTPGAVDKCSTELSYMNTILNGTRVAMAAAAGQISNEVQPGVSDTLSTADSTASTSQTEMNKTVADTVEKMQKSQQQITKVFNQVDTTVNEMLKIIYNVQDSVNSAHHKIVTWSGYGPVKSGIRAAMTVPNAIALFFVTLVTVMLIVRLVKTNDPRDRSSLSHATGYFSIVGFYCVLFLTWLAMGIASVAFVGGWAISGACVPMFEDNSFRIYGLINSLTFPIQSANGSTINVSTQQILQSCYANETLFSAVNGSLLLNADMINQQIDLSNYQQPINEEIQGIKIDYTVDPSVISATKATATASKTQAELYPAYPLPNCGAQVTKVRSDIKQLSALLNTISQQSDQLLAIVKKVANNANDQQNLKDQMQTYTDGQFVQANTTINNSTNSLITELNTNIYPCYPLYVVYSNTGSIMCDRVGRPLHGLWAAAGLAALFFIPAALALLFATKWLFRMKYGQDRYAIGDEAPKPKKTKSKKNDSVTEDDVFARPPITAYPNERDGLPRSGQANPAYLSDDLIERWATDGGPAARGGLYRAPEETTWAEQPAPPSKLYRPDQQSVGDSRPSTIKLHRPDAERWGNDSDEEEQAPGWSSSALRRL